MRTSSDLKDVLKKRWFIVAMNTSELIEIREIPAEKLADLLTELAEVRDSIREALSTIEFIDERRMKLARRRSFTEFSVLWSITATLKKYERFKHEATIMVVDEEKARKLCKELKKANREAEEMCRKLTTKKIVLLVPVPVEEKES